MRKLTLLAAAAAALMAGSAAGAAQAAPSLYVAPAPTISAAVYTPADRPLLQTVQYFYGGRNYCWYDDAWNGPGYYWCGYRYRRGFGWGGGLGFRGWGGGGHYRGAGYSVSRGHFGGGHSGHGGGGHSGGGHGGGHGGGGNHHH